MSESLNEPERGDLSSVRREPVTPSSIDENYHIELVRKSIHLFSLSIPIIYYFISQATALSILIPLTAAFFIVDIARYYYQPVAAWFYATFGWLLRSKERDVEKKRLNGATNVLLSATLCVLVFPKLITVTAFSILIVSDSTAALIGRKFGKHPFLKKTAEGSAAFFLSAVAVVALAPKVENSLGEYLIGIFAGGIGTLVEAVSMSIDDNISIPVSVGVALWLLYLVFYPALEISNTPTL